MFCIEIFYDFHAKNIFPINIDLTNINKVKAFRNPEPTKMPGSVTLITDVQVASLAWNHEGTRLLTAGEVLQMWKYNEKTKFEVSKP